MPGPEDERTAAAAGRGRQRVSSADRERVIELLKVAFVQDRLTQDELDTRVGLALASRTYAELADLTADIPAEPTAAVPPAAVPPAVRSAAAGPAVAERATELTGTPARTLGIAVRRAGICVLTPLALFGVLALANAQSLLGLAVVCAVVAAIAASGFLGYGVVDAWQQRRSRAQQPPRPGQGRQPQDVRWPGRVGRDPALPRDHPDQAHAGLPSDPSRPGRPRSSGRRARTPRGLRPATATM